MSDKCSKCKEWFDTLPGEGILMDGNNNKYCPRCAKFLYRPSNEVKATEIIKETKTREEENENKPWTKIYPMILILIFLAGILLGIQIGTYAVIDHISYGLAGSTFIINVNETRMVDYTLQRFNETILPELMKNIKEEE